MRINEIIEKKRGRRTEKVLSARFGEVHVGVLATDPILTPTYFKR
jgi:hypothetical protein